MTKPSLQITLMWGIIMIFGSLILTACQPAEQTPAASPSPTTAISAATDTPAPQPSPTPTAAPPLAIFLAPAGADAALVEAVLPVVEEQARQSGLRFEQRQELSLTDVQADVRVVVGLPPAGNLAELAAAAPQTAFIALGSGDLTPGKNLSVVQLPGSVSDSLAFIAGYLGGALAQDWHTGVLAVQGAPESAAAAAAYANGLAYLCGLCLPVYPPFPINGYPISLELAEPADPTGWASAIAELQNWQVQVVYVTPQAASAGLYQALAQAGFQIIGIGAPPEGTQTQWIVSLGMQELAPIVLQAWESMLSGSEGQAYAAELALSQVNPELLSPGKEKWVQAVIADLADGFIETGNAP